MEYLCVDNESQIREVADMAGKIFSEYYLSLDIMSAEQNNYMIEKFLSEKAIKEQISEHGYEYYFFCNSGKRVGFCAVHPENGKLFLSKLYLYSDCRGKGYGKEALDFLEGLCLGKGLNAIWLTVNRDNKHSIDFYLKRGFKILRSEDNEIGHGYVMNDYIMELEVS